MDVDGEHGWTSTEMRVGRLYTASIIPNVTTDDVRKVVLPHKAMSLFSTGGHPEYIYQKW